MKTIEKTFDAVQFMRQQRDRLSKELTNKSKQQILDYFKNKRKSNSVMPTA